MTSDPCFYFSLEQVKEKIATDEFKPNCALVVLDFMIRHGLVTPDNGKLVAFVKYLVPSLLLVLWYCFRVQTVTLLIDWVNTVVFFLLQNLIMLTLFLDLTVQHSNMVISCGIFSMTRGHTEHRRRGENWKFSGRNRVSLWLWTCLYHDCTLWLSTA